MGDLSEEFGKWPRVYRQFRRWTPAGLWEDVMNALNRSGALPDSLQINDSTVVRAHRQLAGSKRAETTTGFRHSHGGFTTKFHLLVNGHGLPVNTEITPGQTSNYRGFDLVMADNLRMPSVFHADRNYDADRIRKAVEAREGLPMIPMRKSRRMCVGVDRSLYRPRNLVKGYYKRLKNARRVATRDDKAAENFLGSSTSHQADFGAAIYQNNLYS